MAFSGSIKARERPCTKGERKTVSDRKGKKLREKETQNRGRTRTRRQKQKTQRGIKIEK
jgi:hypothetical protein